MQFTKTTYKNAGHDEGVWAFPIICSSLTPLQIGLYIYIYTS